MKPILLIWSLFLAGSTLAQVQPSTGVASSADLFTPAANNWQTQTTGITGGALYAVSVVDGNVCWLAGTPGRIIRTTDGGNMWLLVGSPSLGSVNALEGVSDSIAFASTTVLDLGTFIRRTTNAGSSWHTVYSHPDGFIFAIKMFNPTRGIAVGDPVGGQWMILKTTNGGESWFRISTEPPQIGGTSGGTGFGALDTSYVWFFDNTGRNYWSNDGGETWSYSPNPGSGTILYWWNTRNLALAVTPMVVYRYEFGWVTVGSTPRLLFPPTGLVGAIGTREFWLAQDAIYYTSNAGSSWTVAPPHGLNKRVSLIDMITLGSEVSAWATGIGDTVYHYHRILTGVDEHPQPIPREFSLGQNYPNPFNPTTTIRYEIASEGEVKLEIFNVIGQRVATLANETKTPGRYDVVWDGRNDAGLQLPSGVCFYRLHVSGGGKSFVAVMKLMLLK